MLTSLQELLGERTIPTRCPSISTEPNASHRLAQRAESMENKSLRLHVFVALLRHGGVKRKQAIPQPRLKQWSQSVVPVPVRLQLACNKSETRYLTRLCQRASLMGDTIVHMRNKKHIRC